MSSSRCSLQFLDNFLHELYRFPAVWKKQASCLPCLRISIFELDLQNPEIREFLCSNCNLSDNRK
jgi:hypothetical protein